MLNKKSPQQTATNRIGANEMNQDKYRTLLDSMQRDSHVKCVLRHLLDYGSISSLEAFAEYSNTRLSATIYILKHTYGGPIVSVMEHSTNRYGHKIAYARYELGEENDTVVS